VDHEARPEDSLDWDSAERTRYGFSSSGSIPPSQCLWRRGGIREEACVALTTKALRSACETLGSMPDKLVTQDDGSICTVAGGYVQNAGGAETQG